MKFGEALKNGIATSRSNSSQRTNILQNNIEDCIKSISGELDDLKSRLKEPGKSDQQKLQDLVESLSKIKEPTESISFGNVYVNLMAQKEKADNILVMIDKCKLPGQENLPNNFRGVKKAIEYFKEKVERNLEAINNVETIQPRSTTIDQLRLIAGGARKELRDLKYKIENNPYFDEIKSAITKKNKYPRKIISNK